MTGQTPPGWYQDPYGTPGLQRYWDGGQWTQATQPADEWDDAESPQGAGGSGGSPANYAPPRAPGPVTPPPWSSPQGPMPQGPMTPQPWQPPSQPLGPSTPQPWQPAQQPRKSNTGLVWGLAGGGVIVVALIVVVALVATGTFKDDEPRVAIGGPSSSGAPPSANPTAQSPRTGTIVDDLAGVSYAQLGGKWRLTAIPPNSGFSRNYGFDKGQVAVVQENYSGTSPYLASVYSGRLSPSFLYKGTGDLETAATNLGRRIESEPEPNGSYPSHTRQDLESKSSTVGGKPAWYLKFRLTFPQAQSRGWNFRTETAVFLVIDQGTARRPGVVWVTVPDSHENGGDLDLLVNSVKVQ